MKKSDLVSEIVNLDRLANRVIRRHSFRTWMELNVTVPQIRSLFFVSNEPDTNPRKLATALGVTPPNVTGIIDRLVEQGLLDRRESQEDRRVLMLRVTKKGEAILSSLREQRTTSMREILDRLSVQELSYLNKGLSALVKATQAYEEEGQR